MMTCLRILFSFLIATPVAASTATPHQTPVFSRATFYEQLISMDVGTVDKALQSLIHRVSDPAHPALSRADQMAIARAFTDLALDYGLDRRISMDESEQFLVQHGDSIPETIRILARQAINPTITVETLFAVTAAALMNSLLPAPEIDRGLQRLASVSKSNLTVLTATQGLIARHEYFSSQLTQSAIAQTGVHAIALNAELNGLPPPQQSEPIDLVDSGPGYDDRYAFQENQAIAKKALARLLSQTDSDYTALNAAEAAIDAGYLDLPIATRLEQIIADTRTSNTAFVQGQARKLLLALDEALYLNFVSDRENSVETKWVVENLTSFVGRGSRNPLIVAAIENALKIEGLPTQEEVALERLLIQIRARIDLTALSKVSQPDQNALALAQRFYFVHGADRSAMLMLSQVVATWVRFDLDLLTRAEALRILLRIEGAGLEDSTRLQALGFVNGKIPDTVLGALSAGCESLFTAEN
ncbi:MAG: hypothetical protein AAB425_01745 [Bdellovibrionota bacterium]